MISDENFTVFIDVNDSAVKLYGYSRSTFLKTNPSEIIVSDINDGYPVHRNKKGELLNLVIRTSKIVYKDSKAILAVITGNSDVEELNERFGQLAENPSDVYFIIDPSDGRTVYVSPSFSSVWERDPDELYSGQINYNDFLHPDDRDRIINNAAEELRKGNDFSEEFRILTPGKKIKWISVKAFSLKDKKGKLQRVTGVAADITERKKSENELKKIIKKEQEALKAAEQAKEKLAFLAEASELLSSSLDYQQTLKSVAQLATPSLSDWCVVDILDENNELKRLAVSHINQDKIELAIEIHKKYGPSPDETAGVYNVIKTGTSELYPEIPEELIRARAKNEEHLKMSLALGLKSGIIVPLKVRDQVFGALTLIYAESDRRYNETDLVFVEDLARRAAIAIDNSKLFEKAGILNSELDRKILDLEKEISNRKQIESVLIDNQEKLISSEERLKAALSASETGTYRWYIENNELHFDDSLLKIFGLPAGINITYEEYLNRVHSEDLDNLLTLLERSINQNADFDHEYRIIWDDGSVHWIMDKAKILNIDGSKPLYMTGACVDITYRKHAEQTLRDSEILFRQMAENIRDVFFIINPVNNNVIYVSPIFEDIWGIKREELY